MENKNRFLLEEIRDTIPGEKIVIVGHYIPDPNDPKHDDLPSERLQVGREYYVTFTPVIKPTDPEFNNGVKKKD